MNAISLQGPPICNRRFSSKERRFTNRRPKTAISNRRSLMSNPITMRLRHLYLLLCVLGTILPYWKLIPWLIDHGLSVSLLCQELFATRIGAFFGLDVIVSALVLFIFIATEGRRLALSLLWLPVIATLLVGVSLGFPLFLYLRQRQLDVAAPPR
jgi:Terpene cyclase DEP1